jgi:hypothetical protein
LTALTGVSEKALREHSPAWLEDLARRTQQRRMADRADLLELIALGSSAPHGEENLAQVTETVERLRTLAAGEEAVEYLLDPNAKPDFAAIRQVTGAGLAFQRVPGPHTASEEQASDRHQANPSAEPGARPDGATDPAQ